jgi:RNA polymerase sigma-70 factor (ECF subfamily)
MLESLYDKHSTAILAFAVRRTGSMQEAQEVVQETFLVAWRRVGVIPQDEPLLWLYGVARNVIANQARSKRRRSRLLDKAAMQPTIPDDPGMGTDLSDALAKLRPAHREALALAYWEELSPAQAAKVIGRSRAAYNTLLHRARRALRRVLEEGNGEGNP